MKTPKNFAIIYSLFVGGRDTDYTTEGATVALIAGVLRAQERRAEAQVVTERRTVDLRLPVVAAVTSEVQIAITIVVVAFAEEGEFWAFRITIFSICGREGYGLYNGGRNRDL